MHSTASLHLMSLVSLVQWNSAGIIFFHKSSNLESKFPLNSSINVFSKHSDIWGTNSPYSSGNCIICVIIVIILFSLFYDTTIILTNENFVVLPKRLRHELLVVLLKNCLCRLIWLTYNNSVIINVTQLLNLNLKSRLILNLV